MRFLKRLTPFYILVFLCSATGLKAQHSALLSPKNMLRFFKKQLPIPIPDSALSRAIPHDSTLKKQLLSLIHIPDTSFRPQKALQQVALPKLSFRPLIQFNGGYINYSWNFRSGIDTPIAEKNISQHLIASNINLTLGNNIPIRVTYFQRVSNSAVFRDFHDVRVDFNTQEFHRRQTDRIRAYVDSAAGTLREPFIKPAMDLSLKKLQDYNKFLNHTEFRNKLLAAKEILINPDVTDHLAKPQRDSATATARAFVALYDSLKVQEKKYHKLYDSLQSLYSAAEQKIASLRKLSASNLENGDNMKALQKSAGDAGLNNNRFERLTHAFSAIRTFSIGKTNPSYTNLTVKNVNVRGFNVVYNLDNLILAGTAGAVDYRVRDFVVSGQRRVPQYLYAGRIGYGQLNGNNLILTYYEGKKQLNGGTNASFAQPIRGVSLSTQLVLAHYHRFTAEIAQSATPPFLSSPGKRPGLQFTDKNSQAFLLSLRSYLPVTKTRIEAQYQRNGLNFQSFAGYRVNAASTAWSVRAEQPFFHRAISIVAGLRTNDFSNPLLLQRYSANNVFKTISATVRLRHLPTLSLAYMPSSQLTVIDSNIYENHYQVLNASLHHQYHLGIATATTLVMLSRFYNHASDTGFLFYNSRNLYLSQSIQFALFTTNLNLTRSQYGKYSFETWDAGLAVPVLSKHQLGGGIKLNHVNTEPGTRVGMYCNARYAIAGKMDISMWLEKTYLQGLHHQLIKNEFYNIGFTRYFR